MATFELEKSDAVAYEVIPADEILNAEVSAVEVKETPFDDERNPGQKQKQVSFKFLISDGPHQGRILWGNTSTIFNDNENCKLRQWVQAILGQDTLPVGFKFDTETLLGLPVRVVVGNRGKKNANGSVATHADGSPVLRDYCEMLMPAKAGQVTNPF
jgi:hypothetical protein